MNITKLLPTQVVLIGGCLKSQASEGGKVLPPPYHLFGFHGGRAVSLSGLPQNIEALLSLHLETSQFIAPKYFHMGALDQKLSEKQCC